MVGELVRTVHSLVTRKRRPILPGRQGLPASKLRALAPARHLESWSRCPGQRIADPARISELVDTDKHRSAAPSCASALVRAVPYLLPDVEVGPASKHSSMNGGIGWPVEASCRGMPQHDATSNLRTVPLAGIMHRRRPQTRAGAPPRDPPN